MIMGTKASGNRKFTDAEVAELRQFAADGFAGTWRTGYTLGQGWIKAEVMKAYGISRNYFNLIVAGEARNG